MKLLNNRKSNILDFDSDFNFFKEVRGGKIGGENIAQQHARQIVSGFFGEHEIVKNSVLLQLLWL